MIEEIKKLTDRINGLEDYHNKRIEILENFQNHIRREQGIILEDLKNIKLISDKVYNELMVDDRNGDSVVTKVKSLNKYIDSIEKERQDRIKDKKEEAKYTKMNKRKAFYKIAVTFVVLFIGWLFSKSGVDKVFLKLVKIFE